MKKLLKLFEIFITIFMSCTCTKNETSKYFHYFAYGSNMLTDRIHINNLDAKQKYIGKIKNYRFDFTGYSNHWNGCVSTIVPDVHSEVWGVVWKLNITNINNLDKQEGVYKNTYFPKHVYVNISTNKNIICRTYQHTKPIIEYIEPNLLPDNRQPSLKYLNTIIDGAKEHHIPVYYINFLKSFKYVN